MTYPSCYSRPLVRVLLRVLLGLLAGLAFVHWLLPDSLLMGHGAFWTHGDPGAHTSAFQLYVNDSWHAPMLYTTALNHPEGINIAFADVIPLMALFVKALGIEVTEPGRFFGGWIMLCYALQGATAAFLLMAAGLKDWRWLLPGILLFLLSPTMLFRIHAHTALASHFVILVALAIYWRAHWAPERAAAALLAVAPLCLAALMIHPYLAAMTLAICLAAFTLPELWQQQARIASAALLAVTVLIPAYLFLGGYLSDGIGGKSGMGGFGVNSMNLAAPLAGGSLQPFAALEDQSGRYGALPMPYDATGGQYEGYNHLGLGVLFLLCAGTWLQRRELLRALATHWRIVTLALGFTAYALSNKAYLLAHPLWDFALPNGIETLPSQFRSSGRFFWPVGYVLLTAAVVSVARSRTHSAARDALLLTALALQFADTQALRQLTRDTTGMATAPFTVNDPRVKQAISASMAVYVLPTFGCGARPFEDVVPLQVLAADAGVAFNTGLIARGYSGCAEKERTAREALGGRATFFFLGHHPRGQELYESMIPAMDRSLCFRSGNNHVCPAQVTGSAATGDND